MGDPDQSPDRGQMFPCVGVSSVAALILLFKVGYVARNDQGRVLEQPAFEDA